MSKFKAPVTGLAVGNFMKKFFPNMKVKQGRSKYEWTKKTNRYYGIKWRNANQTEIAFREIFSIVPSDFFILSNLTDALTLGHFTGNIINGSKVLIEIILKNDKSWKLLFRGKTIKPESLGINAVYTIATVFDIVRQLNYCRGVQKIDESKKKMTNFKEHVSKAGDENSNDIFFGSGSCTSILPFKTSNTVSFICSYCKKLERPPKLKPENNVKSDQDCANEPNSLDVNSNECILNKNSTHDNEENSITLCESDNNDMSTILNNIFPDCSDKMKTFLISQKMALERHPNGRRWNRDIVQLCLSLWCRSPRGYTDLRNSKFLVLPSQKLLQRYKNRIHQEAGINKEMLHWMKNEAKLKNIPPEGYDGGLIFDEMSIQADLQFKKKDGDIQLIGFAECLPESLVFNQMAANKKQQTLATHALQLMFLGFTGFRFPFAHFPSTTASGHELYLLLWESVNMLSNFGFKIQFISTDGAQSNRDLFKLLLPEFSSMSPVTCSFKNIYSYDNPKIFFIMDISHVIKKVRNNILKSGTEAHCKRHLVCGEKYIEWSHFKQAYLWDISSHVFPVYHKLTQEHFFLTSEAKMRNYLAEDVLNCDMLHLMEFYRNSLGDGGSLDATIELLKCTSVLIRTAGIQGLLLI
ncbi:uncharacterized protein [Mytilus edulis]|uniref:uncharacterized protein n=1 Tax=Mytilus edulis TaxID=6550 RepID=UPI0039F142BE